jgi:rhodanese-related sulfurtransferase
MSMPEFDMEEEQARGRWQRRRNGGGRWLLKVLLLSVGVPILLGALVALVAGRSIAFAVVHRLTARKFPEVRWIEPAELARWREDPGRAQPVVLDTRTQDEYAVSHLRGAIRIDPYRPILRPIRQFPKDTPIVVYSSTGYRSARVARFLSGQNYSNVENLDGSLFQWANEGRPIFRDDHPVTEVHPYDGRWGLLLDGRYRAAAPELPKQSAAP